MAAMNRDLKNITERIDEENLKEIHKWLKENIHRHGAVYTPKELIMNISNDNEYFKRGYKFNLLYRVSKKKIH